MAFENVEMYQVTSSNVAAFGFDQEDEAIYVQFNNGYIYWYKAPYDVYEQMMMAESKGRFIHTDLKGIYEYGRLI